MDESETDGVLSTILNIIMRIHHEFFLNLVSMFFYLFFSQILISPTLLTKLDDLCQDTGADVIDRDVRMVSIILKNCVTCQNYLKLPRC